MRAAIVVADSVTALGARHEGAVLVSGSHGGLIAARYAAAAGVRAAVFNDAGIGLDDAGIMGLQGKDKNAARHKALSLFPKGGFLVRVKDHNRAEALLIAEHLRRQRNGSAS